MTMSEPGEWPMTKLPAGAESQMVMRLAPCHFCRADCYLAIETGLLETFQLPAPVNNAFVICSECAADYAELSKTR